MAHTIVHTNLFNALNINVEKVQHLLEVASIGQAGRQPALQQEAHQQLNLPNRKISIVNTFAQLLLLEP